jgi:hypothetical protein
MSPKCPYCGDVMDEYCPYEDAITIYECSCGYEVDEYGDIKEKPRNDESRISNSITEV